MKLYFIDTEATGLSFDKDQLCQVSIIAPYEKFEYNRYINPTIKISHNATIKTGLYENHPLLLNAKKMKDLNDEIVDNLSLYEDDIYYIGHNISFDREMLERNLTINNKSNFDKNVWIDTLKLSQILFNDIMIENNNNEKQKLSLSLESLFYYLKLYEKCPEINFHNSYDDVKACIYLYLELCRLLKLDAKNPQSVINYIHDNKPYTKIFSFGKYKNESIAKIVKQNPEYIHWLLNNSDSLNENNPNFDEALYRGIEKALENI